MPTIGFLEAIIILIVLAIFAAVIYSLFLLIRVLIRANRKFDMAKQFGQGQGPLTK